MNTEDKPKNVGPIQNEHGDWYNIKKDGIPYDRCIDECETTYRVWYDTPKYKDVETKVTITEIYEILFYCFGRRLYIPLEYDKREERLQAYIAERVEGAEVWDYEAIEIIDPFEVEEGF